MDNMEREIDLRQLIVYILMQWRLLIAVCVVCALLGGVFKVATNRPRVVVKNDQAEIYDDKLARYEIAKAAIEADMKTQARLLENEQAKQTLASTSRGGVVSLLTAALSFDGKPGAAAESSRPPALQAAAEALENDAARTSPANLLLEAVNTDAFWAEVAEKLKTTPAQVREAVTAGSYAAGRLVVNIEAPDAETAEMLLDHIVSRAEVKPRRVEKATATGMLDLARVDQQRRDQATRAGLEGTLRTLNWYYYSLAEPPKPAAARRSLAASAPVSRKRAFVKGGTIGAVGGGFAAVMLLALRLIMPGLVLSSGEFFGKYPYKCLTVLPPRARRRKMLLPDRLLLRWADNPRYVKQSVAERYAVAADGIKSQLNQLKGDSLLLLGSVDTARLQEVKAALAPGLPDCALGCRRFVDQELDTLHDIDRHDNIVLVESVLSSRYQDVDHEVQALTERGKKVLGCIVV